MTYIYSQQEILEKEKNLLLYNLSKITKRNYCMQCKSILTKERTNNNESLKDTSSQSTYEDFVVKDILINKQND